MAATPFFINDCAIAPIATGLKARSLTEFRDRIETIHHGCIYFHFWIGRLRTAYEYKEHRNDFAQWSHKALHDDFLAERLELLDPTQDDLETLRIKLIELVDERIDELEVLPSAHKSDQFHFINSKIIVFKTPLKLENPSELPLIIPQLTRSSIFYHFIDSRRRTAGHKDDFSIWLESYGNEYRILIEQLKDIDPYFISLQDLQDKLTSITKEYFKKE